MLWLMARQRFQRADQADSDCTPASDANKPLLSTQTGGGETVSVSIPAQTMNALVFSFTMAAGDPGGGEDLPASSLMRAQLDVSVMDSQISCKVEFHALNSGCTSQGNAAMGEGDFTGIGTKLATATWDPPVADRYQVRVLATNSEGHGGPAGTLTLRTNNSDARLEIPDAPAGGGSPKYYQNLIGVHQG